MLRDQFVHPRLFNSLIRKMFICVYLFLEWGSYHQPLQWKESVQLPIMHHPQWLISDEFSSDQLPYTGCYRFLKITIINQKHVVQVLSIA